MRIVIGVRVIVTMSSGIRTVRVAEKQPRAQKSPHGERPYFSTTLTAAVCRKPLRSAVRAHMGMGTWTWACALVLACMRRL